MAGHIASSSSIDWNTPEKVLKHVREMLGTIDLDPCSNSNSVVGAGIELRLPKDDGLLEPWCREGVRTVYVNPPFGSYYLHKTTKQVVLPKVMKELVEDEQVDKEDYDLVALKDWVAKAEREAAGGVEVIMLLPAAVGTKAWQKHILQTAGAVCFVSGRLRFVGASAGAPMDCACVYWGPRSDRFAETFEELGMVVAL